MNQIFIILQYVEPFLDCNEKFQYKFIQGENETKKLWVFDSSVAVNYYANRLVC